MQNEVFFVSLLKRLGVPAIVAGSTRFDGAVGLNRAVGTVGRF